MRSEAKREIERMVDDILAKFDARVRRPLNEMTSFFEWLRRVKFNSRSNERLTATALAAEMEKFEKSIFLPEDEVKALSAMIAKYRQYIGEMAKKGEQNA